MRGKEAKQGGKTRRSIKKDERSGNSIQIINASQIGKKQRVCRAWDPQATAKTVFRKNGRVRKTSIPGQATVKMHRTAFLLSSPRQNVILVSQIPETSPPPPAALPLLLLFSPAAPQLGSVHTWLPPASWRPSVRNH